MRRILFQSILLISVFFSTACVATKPVMVSDNEKSIKREFVESNPPERPDWVDSIPQSDDELYFVGLSNGNATEKEARSDAYQNVLNQVVKYYGELIKSQASETKSVKALSSDVIDPYIESEEKIQRYAQAYVHEILPENYYTEHWLNGFQDEYKCWVKCSVSKQKIQKEIENFAADISERYSSLLPENQNKKYNSTKSVVEAYLAVYEAVRKNPIHQAVAYAQTSAGKAALDEYALQQAKRIIQNISIERIDSTAYVEQGSQFYASVHLRSPDYEKITGMQAIVTLVNKNKKLGSTLYGINDKNEIEIIINTEKLSYGDYSVQIQLLTDSYAALGTVYAQNSSIAFAFGLIHAGLEFVYSDSKYKSGELEKQIENALQEQVLNHELPIVLDKNSHANPQWRFIMQIDCAKLKSAENVEKIRVKETVLLRHKDSAKCKSAEFSGIGLSKTEEFALRSATEECVQQLKEDIQFYQSILKTIGEKRK